MSYADRSRLVDESAWALSGGANPTATCVIEAKGARWILDGLRRQKSGHHDKQLWETLGAYRVVETNPWRWKISYQLALPHVQPSADKQIRNLN
jgi:hypothetical protein